MRGRSLQSEPVDAGVPRDARPPAPTASARAARRRRFQNLEGDPDHTFHALLRWVAAREPGRWDPWREFEPGPPPPERVRGGEVRVTLVGHSTVLVQMDGLNLLTDPIWSHRASPVGFAGPRRRVAAGVRFEDLPPVDAVLVSHDHYDHLDLPTLGRLRDRFDPLVLTGTGNERLLARAGLDRHRGLAWWDRVDLAPGVGATFVPARHTSKRSLGGTNASLWGGFVVEGPSGRVYFAGDTGFGLHFGLIRERLGPPDLALLPIGAFQPRWFMSPMHLSPEDAVRAAEVLQAGTSVAIHWGTFPLADDHQDEPVQALERALAGSDLSPDRFLVLPFGQGLEVRRAGDQPPMRV